MKKVHHLLALTILALGMIGPLAAEDIPAPDDVAAPPADAEVADSGLASKVLTPGDGTEHPGPTDIVQVHYTGWTADGAMFASTASRGEPEGLPVSKLLPGWAEGLQLMVVGETRRLWIPEELGFQGREGKPAGMLVFDVELLGFQPDPSIPPDDVAGPPADAEVTKSGLASKVLEAGTGTQHPKKGSTVKVHYTGWTTDGQMFDSSELRGQPVEFPLNQVIKGWTEGVQLMVVGEKRRFWIPQKLAYKGAAGKPAGMLVFDVLLIDFQ